MPVYVYEVIRRDEKPGRRFEIFQRLTEKALKRDPDTGEPVRRVFYPPHLPQNRYEKAVKAIEKKDRAKPAKPARKRS